jgi:hypothetical protein
MSALLFYFENRVSHSKRSVDWLSIIRKLSGAFISGRGSLLLVSLGGSENSELASGLQLAFASSGFGQHVLKTNPLQPKAKIISAQKSQKRIHFQAPKKMKKSRSAS